MFTEANEALDRSLTARKDATGPTVLLQCMKQDDIMVQSKRIVVYCLRTLWKLDVAKGAGMCIVLVDQRAGSSRRLRLSHSCY